MLAVRLQPTVLIPTREGELALPPIELAWWDTEAEVARTAPPSSTAPQLSTAAGQPQLSTAAGQPQLSTIADTWRQLSVPVPAPDGRVYHLLL